MTRSERHTFSLIACEFSPAAGVNVRRELLVATNGNFLFDQLTERAGRKGAAAIGEWHVERLALAAECASKFCQRRYLLPDHIVIATATIQDPVEVSPAMLSDPMPQFLPGGIVWLQSDHAAPSRSGALIR